MDRIRLIYEQIEEAKKYLLSKSLLRLRLALILLDNAAELMMYRALRDQVFRDDAFARITIQSENVALQVPAELRIKYTPNERRNAEKHFERMTALLSQKEVSLISTEERRILDITHSIRKDAFHRSVMREEALQQIAILLFRSVVGLTCKLKATRTTLSELTPEQKSIPGAV